MGVLHGDVVHTLTEPPFEGVRYDGESLPLSGCRLLAPVRPQNCLHWKELFRPHP